LLRGPRGRDRRSVSARRAHRRPLRRDRRLDSRYRRRLQGLEQWFRGSLPFETDEGEWREGRQSGFGSQVWPTGRYDGELVDGEPSGRGTLIVQGVRYEGELRSGKPNGFGTLTNAGGTFRGTWRDGCLQDQKQKAAFGVPLSAC
jgi:hypothetical protein